MSVSVTKVGCARWLARAAFAGCVGVLCWGVAITDGGVYVVAPVASQDWSVEGGADRSAEIVRRYREILERRPEEGRILDMLIQEVGTGRGLDALIDDYSARLERDAGSFSSAMMLGHLLRRQDRNDEAAAAYERAMEIDPESALPWRSVGVVYRRLDRRAESEAAFERALELAESTDAQREILRALADLAFDAREWESASAYVERLLALAPGDAYLRMELAEVYLRHRRYDEALAQYEEVATRAGRDTRQRALAMRDQGDVLALMGRGDESLAQYRAAMRLIEPGYWLYRELEQRVVDVYRSQHRLEELVEDFRAQWRNPTFAQMLMLSELYDELGMDAEALDLLESAVRRDARSVDARLALIRVLERRGEIELVVEQYQTLIRQQPGDAGFRFSLFDVYRRTGQRDEALDVLDTMSERFAGTPHTLSEVADRYVRMRESDRALAIYERLVRVAPNDPSYRIALGGHYFMEARRSEAERVWREIVPLERTLAEGHARLADVFNDHGLVEEAIIEYEIARDLAPDNESYIRNLAQLYESGRRMPQALRLWELILERSAQPQLRAEARTAIVRVYSALGRLQDVIPDYRAQFYAAEPSMDAGFILAEAYTELNDDASAEETYLAILAVDDSNLAALQVLERMYTTQNRIPDAIEILLRIADAHPARARETYHRLAELSLRSFDDEQAVVFARMAVELNPDDAAAQARLAHIYRQMQRLDDAVQAYRHAIALDERAFQIYFDLADVYLATDRTREAGDLYRHVMVESNDEAQVLRAGRRAIRIHQGLSTLDDLASAVEPRIYRARIGETYLKILIELYDAQVSPLAHGLEFGSRSDREHAQEELERVGRRALRPLLDALAGEDLSMRSTALRIITTVRPPGAATPLVRLLDDPDLSLRMRATHALGVMADPRVGGALARMEMPADSSLRLLHTWALARCADTEGRDRLIELATSRGQPPGVRAIATTGLARFEGDAVVRSTLQRLIVSEIALVQQAAVWAVGYGGYAELADELIFLLAHGLGHTPSAAAWSLGALPVDARTVSALLEASIVGGNETRRVATSALAFAGDAAEHREYAERVHTTALFYQASTQTFDDEGYVFRLVHAMGAAQGVGTTRALLEHEATFVQVFTQLAASDTESALALLRALDARDGVTLALLESALSPSSRAELASMVERVLASSAPALLRLTSHRDARIRRGAISVLSKVPDARLTVDDEVWRAALADANGEVRRAGLQGVARRGRASLAGEAATLLRDPDWGVRFDAARAMVEVGAGFGDVLAGFVEQETYVSVRGEALVALLAHAPDQGRAHLDAWPELPTPMRVAVAREIERFNPSVAAQVRDLVATDRDPRVRSLAPRTP